MRLITTPLIYPFLPPSLRPHYSIISVSVAGRQKMPFIPFFSDPLLWLLYWRIYIYIITETQYKVHASISETSYFPTIKAYSPYRYIIASEGFFIYFFYLYLRLYLCSFSVFATHLSRFTLNSWPSVNIVLCRFTMTNSKRALASRS